MEIEATPEARFLVDLFNSLNSQGLAYCVARNYEKLPDDLCGHDLDLIIEENSIEKMLGTIKEVCGRHRGATTRLRGNADGLSWVKCAGVTESGAFWGVHIDLICKVMWRGLELERIENCLRCATWHGMVRVLPEERAAVLAWLDKVLYAGPSTPGDRWFRYYTRAAEAYRNYPNEVERCLGNIFGKEKKVLVEMLRKEEFGGLREALPKLKTSLLLLQIKKSPFAILRNKWMNQLIHLKRLWNRPGVVVAVAGPDGSGKSTLIKLAQKDVQRFLHSGAAVFSFRPGILPRLAVLLRRKSASDCPEDNPFPHSEPPSGLAGSVLRLGYYTFDYVIGFALLYYTTLLRRADVVFFDRYFYDYYIDPWRWRIRAPHWVLRLFETAIPSPDLTIMLCPNARTVTQESRNFRWKK